MIGEIPPSEGNLSLDGLLSYSSQTPWVFSGSVKENILFGRPFDQNRYEAVLEACDLKKDITRFANGDLTLIGQRGVTMSGGQRARISLARAVYPKGDVYLLDDPLSAVDATVAKNIFEKCIVNLLSGKLRVLVTHQMQFLKCADHIVMLKKGKVTSQGSYLQLRESGALTSTLELDIEAEGQEAARRASVLADIEHSKDFDDEDTAVDMEQAEEHRATGSVTYKTYWNCFRAGLPTILVVGLALTFAAGQVAIMSPHIWLSHMLNMSRDQQEANANLYIYGGLVMSAWVFSFLRAFYFYYGVIRASAKLHGKMTSSVIKSPVLFFDTTPSGRIYNGFAKDIGTVDELLPQPFFGQFSYWCTVWDPHFCPLAPIIGWLSQSSHYCLCSSIALYYVQTSRQIKRIEAVRCSSVYSHVTETITGLEVIRSSGMPKKFHRFVDQHTQAYFLMFSSGRWLAIRLDSLCVLFVTAVAIAATLVSENAGAGKSSVVTSLFRIPEPRGKIVIDGINILSLNIQCSRRAMSVITQDPVLFSGDLRSNLDPSNSCQDSQLWMALEEVQMKTLVENLPGQLCYAVKESGANFSVGERQLLCLARALLQGNKIILMDEATANVDFETDRLIQEVIRNKFQDCTVLTIAHRLKTVIYYDKILVLDQGQSKS